MVKLAQDTNGGYKACFRPRNSPPPRLPRDAAPMPNCAPGSISPRREVERLLKAAGKNRWGHRDSTMLLVAYRHGLRASELVDLRWDQVDFRAANLHVRRVKQGTPSTHPILGDELRALRRLQREQEPKSPFVFTSERGAPFSTAGFARMVERAGEGAKLGFKAHPHMLRHACGYALAKRGTTQGRCKPILATATFSTRCATPSCHRRGSRISFATNRNNTRLEQVNQYHADYGIATRFVQDECSGRLAPLTLSLAHRPSN